MPKVSIVIPVYNMQKYLDKCMQGIFSQTLEDIEIVLVDDGSSDDSPRLCDEYAKKRFPRPCDSQRERRIDICLEKRVS